MRILIVQPPFVQLNAPYPAVHYLAAWLRERGHAVEVEDHSIELYRLLFSRAGLVALFDEVEARRNAGRYEKTALDQIDRYLSYRRLYEDWIGPVTAWLSGHDPAFAHRLAAAVEFPRGARVEAFLDSRGGRPGPEDAQLLASLLLEDLGDLVTQCTDADFGTVQYGERLGRSRDDFGEVRSSLETSWLMERLYRPWLRERLAARSGNRPRLVLASLPFPGTLVGALAFADEARAAFGDESAIVFGGGYVSTELRGLRDPDLFDFCDFLVFDAGYASLGAILEGLEADLTPSALDAPSLHRTMVRRSGTIVAAGFSPDDLAATEWGCAGPGAAFPRRLALQTEESRERIAAQMEATALQESHPDYRDFDPSRYLRPVDSTNPMHRLWSESPWLKYRLAQGCYWRRCAFCDTELDYVRDFVPVGLPPLLNAMDAASARTGLSGIHFVDEALPMAHLLSFARENRKRARSGALPWHFWGNVRFDASWTPARIELLAASGLVAVSGGIEVATERGLAMTDKGFDLAGLVRTLVSFRQAGVLVHAYLIYGFPGQDEDEIIESAEFVRGLFATGLVDSAFWHRFVLTRHSRMYAEWREGSRPELRPIDRGGAFAANDLDFEGEQLFDRYGAGLDAALGAWMEGEGLDRPAASWLGIVAPRARGQDGPERVETLIAKAEKALDSVPLPRAGQVFWVAGDPRPDGRGRIRWAARGSLEELALGNNERANTIADLVSELAANPSGSDLASFLGKSRLSPTEFHSLLGAGLVVLAAESPGPASKASPPDILPSTRELG